MCVLIFYTTFVSHISHSKNSSARHDQKVYWSSRKVPTFLSDFNETLILSTYFQKFKYQILWKSVQLEPSCSMRTDRRTRRSQQSFFTIFCEYPCVRPSVSMGTHKKFYLLTYILTPWSRVLLEKLTGLQLVKKFPAFQGTRRFITALTSVRHLSLSWASPIQSIYPHPTKNFIIQIWKIWYDILWRRERPSRLRV